MRKNGELSSDELLCCKTECDIKNLDGPGVEQSTANLSKT